MMSSSATEKEMYHEPTANMKFDADNDDLFGGDEFDQQHLDANNNIDDDETVFSLDEYSQDSDLFQEHSCLPKNNPPGPSNGGQGNLPSHQRSRPSTARTSPINASGNCCSERPMGRLQRETPRQISGERQMYFPAMFVEEFRLGNVVFNIPGILKDSLRPSDSMNIKFDFIGHELNKEYIHSRLANLSTSLRTGEKSECGSIVYDLDELKNHTISNYESSPVAGNPTNISSSLSTVSS